ncbi:MAG: dihydroorotate dehydrogenase (quinone) [Candidatus Zixiibacteriota bacterium]
MSLYRKVFPLIKLSNPTLAHHLGLIALRMPIWPKCGHFTEKHAFEWKGIKFRNRLGIAAGFDKDCVALNGLTQLGCGFIEIGTVLVTPHSGNPKPNLKRIPPKKALWNRLGFPSHGVDKVIPRLEKFQKMKQESGVVIASNIGPHPMSMKTAKSADEFASITLSQLLVLVEELYDFSDLFVVNLSSPNTPGLRDLLEQGTLADRVFLPLKERLVRLAHGGPVKPVLLKIGPDDSHEQVWTKGSLSNVIVPMLKSDACDGFVATNTSTRLARELAQPWPTKAPTSGGLSGDPLRETSLAVVHTLRGICDDHGKRPLIIGCGGIMEPEHGRQFLEAGADLVELYTGFIYGGPGILAKVAEGCVG